MRGPYMKLTIGNWLDRVPGFFKSVNVKWNKNYPWEISISHLEGGQDKDGMGIMPHVLDVSCQYQPIHNFLPQKSINDSPFMMIHTNNRAINNNMFKWYQPTIGNNISKKKNSKGEEYSAVNVTDNIARAKIEGWQKEAQTPLYFNDTTKNKTEEPEKKLAKVTNGKGSKENYRVLTPYFSDESKHQRAWDALPRDYKGDIIFKDLSKITMDSPEIKGGFPKFNKASLTK